MCLSTRTVSSRQGVTCRRVRSAASLMPCKETYSSSSIKLCSKTIEIKGFRVNLRRARVKTTILWEVSKVCKYLPSEVTTTTHSIIRTMLIWTSSHRLWRCPSALCSMSEGFKCLLFTLLRLRAQRMRQCQGNLQREKWQIRLFSLRNNKVR